MSTAALVGRVAADKLKLSEAFFWGKLPEGVRGIHQVGIDVVDYSAPIDGLTDDEVQLLRNTIDHWLSRRGHENWSPES